MNTIKHQSLANLVLVVAATAGSLLITHRAVAQITVTSERVETGFSTNGTFIFPTVPSNSSADLANGKAFTVLDGMPSTASGPISVLTNGLAQTNEDSPPESFFSSATTIRVQLDLAGIFALNALNTYSWHGNSHAPQIYKVYGAVSPSNNAPNFTAAGFQDDAGLAALGYTLIASVDNQSLGAAGGQVGVSIAGIIGNYRYLLFDMASPVWDVGPHPTFFGEIDVYGTPADGGNTYANWIAGYPSVPTGLAGFDQDADGDGIDNGAENFFGTNPSIGSSGLFAGVSSGNSFTFSHPQNATPATGVTSAYRWSKDLANFYGHGQTDGDNTTVNFSPPITNAGITTVTATVTGTATTKLFVDVQVLSATQNTAKKMYSRVCYFGDSVILRGYAGEYGGAPGYYFEYASLASWVNWFEVYMKCRALPVFNIGTGASVRRAYDHSYSGFRADQLNDGFTPFTAPNTPVSHVIESIPTEERPKTLVFVQAGTNDLLADATAATIYTRVTTLWTTLQNAGLNICGMAVPPCNSSTHRARAIDLNKQLKDQAKVRGIPFVDIPSAFDDGTDFADDLSDDSRVHPNSHGSVMWAKKIYNETQHLFQPSEFRIPNKDDARWFSPTNMGFPAATEASISTGYWPSTPVEFPGTVTPSIVEDADGRWQRFVVSGAPTGTITYGSPVNGDTVIINGTTFTMDTTGNGTTTFSTIGELELLVEGITGLDSVVDGTDINIFLNGAATLTLSEVGALSVNHKLFHVVSYMSPSLGVLGVGKKYRVVGTVRTSGGAMGGFRMSAMGSTGCFNSPIGSGSAEGGGTDTNLVPIPGSDSTYILVSNPSVFNYNAANAECVIVLHIIGQGTVDFQNVGIIEVP